MSLKSIRATITRVVPSRIEIDAFGGRVEMGNYVEATEDETKIVHVFINDSINEVTEDCREVGTKGCIIWTRSISRNLPFFKKS